MRSMIPNIMYECTGRTLDYPGPPPTQIDPPEPARLPRGAPHTGIPQRACEPADGSSESSLEAAWPPPVAPPQPPDTASARPQHPREQPLAIVAGGHTIRSLS